MMATTIFMDGQRAEVRFSNVIVAPGGDPYICVRLDNGAQGDVTLHSPPPALLRQIAAACLEAAAKLEAWRKP